MNNLEYVTAQYNTQHSYDNGRTGLGGERNGCSVLDWNKVNKIRAMYIKGSSDFGQVALATLFGVSQASVWRILNGKGWKEA